MGQFFSWIRSTQDHPDLQDATVEQQSQQVTPTSEAKISTAKPAQHEKGSMKSTTAAAAVKPGTTPASPAAPSTASTAGAVGGGGAAGTAATKKGPPQVTQQATVSKPTPLSMAKDLPVSSGTGSSGTTGGVVKPSTVIVKPKDPAQEKAQSTTIPSTKLGPAKVDPVVGKPLAMAGLPGSDVQKATSAQKVQVEVGPAAKVSTEAGDPFDALAGTLPSSKPVAPKVPEYKGPEVKEPSVKPEKGVLCGERDDTLPPGYRREDLEKKTPAGVPEKPKNVPKPSLDTDEALDILSGGFVAPAVAPVVKAPGPPQQEKMKPTAVPEKSKDVPKPSLDTDEALDILSGGFVAPAVAPVVKAPGPPQQEKMKPTAVPEKSKDVPKEKTKPSGFPEKSKDLPKPISTDDALDSLSVGFVSSAPSAPKKTELKQQVTSQPANVTKSPAPPADNKAKMEKLDSSMPLDALSSLGDTLGAPEPSKKLPELKPGDIVDEKKIKSEKGVRVGEREDTLPPDYRFSEKELQKLPPAPKEPSLDTDEALDILSGGFVAPAVAPVVKAPGPPQQEKMKPTAVPEKSKDVPKEKTKPSGFPEKSKDLPKPKVEDISALDALAGDFVAPAQTAHKVSSAVPNRVPPGPKQKPETDEDAFSALGDTLGAPEPPKKLPELKPKDIVNEKEVTSEKGVRVGERDDTLPPAYRFSKEDLEKHPPPKTEPSLDVTEALDILSGDFKDTPAASAAKISVCPSSKSPAKKSMDDTAALDHLTSEFTEVPTVKPSAPKAHHFTPEPVPQTHTAPGPALDQLAEKLIPNLLDTKPKDSEPKKPSVEELLVVDKLSGQLSSDVVPSSSTKGGKR